MDAVTVDQISRSYGSVKAVSDLSFEVHAGEMFGLIGPDGAGKTTLIRMLCGLLKPDRGTIRLFGRDPIREHRAVTGMVGYLSQRFSLYGDLSIDENIAFFAEIHGVSGFRARRDRLLAMTQLAPFRDRRADQLSGGMKQKLALACTLVHEPRLILLDEPTTGVDPVSRREFWKLLSEFLQEGLTIVMATPYLDEAERCMRVALMHDGRRLALDEPAALQHAFAGTLIEVVAEPHREAAEVLRALTSPADVQLFGERAHVRCQAGSADAAIARLQAALAARPGIEVSSIRPIAPTLEDVFIEKVTADGSGPTAHGSRAAAEGEA
jgi:ABC-2 type transport system ATP-binding protein